MATINGDDNDNVLNGTTGNDTINGNGGNDTIDAGAGNDIVDGGDGNDTIIGGSGSDTINGGAGDDYIDLLDSTTSAPDTVDAGSGNDTVRAWFGNDTIDGGDGTDLIDYSSIGQATPVDIDLAAGTADIIGATFGSQTVTNFEDATGTFGDDTIAGTDGANVLSGHNGDDILDGRGGDDTIDGGTGNDTIDGGAGNDNLDGGAGNDSVCGGDGNDTISGGPTSGTPLPPPPTLSTEHQFTIVDPDAFTTLNGLPLYYNTWRGVYEPATDEVATIIVNDTGSPASSGLAAVENNSAIGPDTDPVLERVTTSINLALNDNDGAGGSNVGQTLAQPVTIDGITFPAGTAVSTTTEHRFEEYDANGNYVDDFYVFEVTFGTTATYSYLATSKPLVDGHEYVSTSRAGLGTVAYDELTTFNTDPYVPGDDTLCGGDGDDTFVVVAGNDVITDFNTGNTGSIRDGDQSNNDFVNLSGYYSQASYDAAVLAGHIDPLVIKNPLQWLQADQADDGILNDTFAGWDANTTLTLQNGGVPVAGSNLTFDNTNVVCFTKGAMILTPNGEVPVEHLKVGDFVVTMDNGLKPIRWIGCRELNACELQTMPNLRPVLIPAGQLGNKRDLLVSRQHGMVLDTPTGGGGQQLVRACHLAEAQGPIRIANGKKSVCYYHIMFDQHEIIFAEGAPSESFYPGPMGLRALGHSAFCELAQIFPEMRQVLTQCRAPELAYGERARAFAKRKAVLSVAMH